MLARACAFRFGQGSEAEDQRQREIVGRKVAGRALVEVGATSVVLGAMNSSAWRAVRTASESLMKPPRTTRRAAAELSSRQT
jgi:hypothetical protein